MPNLWPGLKMYLQKCHFMRNMIINHWILSPWNPSYNKWPSSVPSIGAWIRAWSPHVPNLPADILPPLRFPAIAMSGCVCLLVHHHFHSWNGNRLGAQSPVSNIKTLRKSKHLWCRKAQLWPRPLHSESALPRERRAERLLRPGLVTDGNRPNNQRLQATWGSSPNICWWYHVDVCVCVCL